MVTAAIIPVAGFGTRLLPLTRSIPKELLPLGQKPVLHHVMDEMSLAGVSSFALVTCERKAAIREYFEHEHSEYRPLYVNQQEQLGLGHAVLCARDLVGDGPFFIALGDAVIHHDNRQETLCQRMQRIFDSEHADAVVAFHQVAADKVNRYGVADVSATYREHFELCGLVEKPDQADAPSRFAIAARYLCTPAVFAELDNTTAGSGGEIQLTDALQGLISHGAKVIGVPLTPGEKRYDIGNFTTYYAAVQEFVTRDGAL